MATRTATTTYSNDTVSLLAVQGKGTDRFRDSGKPETCRSHFGVALTGDLRVTRSDASGGYFFLMLGVGKHADRRRTFFRGDALVNTGSAGVMTVENYFKMLLQVENF